MRTTLASPCLAFLFAALAVGSSAVFAEADVRTPGPDESPANWTAPPFWVPPGETRSADTASTPAAATRTALTSNPPALPFFAVAPCRLADTRSGGGIIHASEVRSFQIPGTCNIPAAAQAVSFNFTVTNTQGPGFLVAYAQNAPFPTVSILNFLAGQTIANAAIVSLSATGGMSAAMGSSASDLIIDVNGYYAPTGIVASVNNLTGDVSLAAGSNVTITPAGATLTISAPLTGLNASNVTSGVLGISFGGTGATTVAGARTNLQAAALGYNTDIQVLAGLVVPISLAQGGTGAAGLPAARYALGAAGWGANVDITSLSGLTTPLSIAQGGTGTATPFASSFQARVTGTCSAGAYVTAVAANGAVTCGSPAFGVRPGFTRASVVPGPNVGAGASATIGADGLGLIGYYDLTTQALKAAHCVDAACTTVTTATLDAVPPIGAASVAIGADGLGLIAYTPDGKRLKVAHCSNAACSSATIATLAIFASGTGGSASLAIGTTGVGVMSYLDGASLMTTACANTACSSGTAPVLLDAAGPLAGTAITVGADGNPLISYTDSYTLEVKVAHCVTPTCTGATKTTLFGSGNATGTSVTMSAQGLGFVTWVDNIANVVRLLSCNDIACVSAGTRAVAASGSGGTGTSITIARDGMAVLVYTGAQTGVVRCTTIACTSWNSVVLDTVSSTSPSVTIGDDGFPVLVYVESLNRVLKTTHCGNEICIPYLRRR